MYLLAFVLLSSLRLRRDAATHSDGPLPRLLLLCISFFCFFLYTGRDNRRAALAARRRPD